MFAYVHIFKTAGTTMTGLLRRNFSTRHFDVRLIHEKPAITASQLRRAMLVYPRLVSIAGHGVRTYSDLKDGFPQIRFYTFLRDPRKRVVSAFLFTYSIRIRHKKWHPETDADIEAAFIQFLRNGREGYCDIFAPKGVGVEAAIEAIETKLDFVGLVEHFDESIALFRNWIGRPDFDLRYRRLNDSDRRSVNDRKFRPFAEDVERLVSATRSLVTRPDIAAMIAETQVADIALFDHVRSKTFERMRRDYYAGPGPFMFEDKTVSADTIQSRLLRDLLGRPLVPLLTRRP
jgi:hypothetical protein